MALGHVDNEPLDLVRRASLLLALDPTQGRPPLGKGGVVKPGLCGALLSELALRQKAAVVGDRVTVTDNQPTGDDLLDEALRVMVGGGGRSNLGQPHHSDATAQRALWRTGRFQQPSYGRYAKIGAGLKPPGPAGTRTLAGSPPKGEGAVPQLRRRIPPPGLSDAVLRAARHEDRKALGGRALGRPGARTMLSSRRP